MTYTASVSAVEAWAIAGAITAVAVATAALGTIRGYRAMRARGWSELAIGWATLSLAWALFAGGWLILGVCWLIGLGGIGRRYEERLSGGIAPDEGEG